MSLDRLTIRGFRNLEPAELAPGAGINWFSGPNGAGKTSVLEAIYLLARGRSFRSARVAGVIQHGAKSLTVVAHRSDSACMLGVERDADGWRGRIEGRDCQRISEFAARLPLVLIEPDSHRLIDGGPDRRRQFLDWQLFHVEQDYLSTWQRFARVLRQRNAALKSDGNAEVLDALDPSFVAAAVVINQHRRDQAGRVEQQARRLHEALAFRLPGAIALHYRAGHPAGTSLPAILATHRDRDRERGFTRHGPHRAELVLTCGDYPAAEMSRGQQKLLAILLQLAHLEILSGGASAPPILLLDDPVSELDAGHLDALLTWLEARAVQSWVTATTAGPESADRFHVEQGKVRQVV